MTFHSPWRSAVLQAAAARARSQVQRREAATARRAPRCSRSQIAALGVHVGLGDLDIVQAHHRVELDRAHLGALADDLPVHLALGRHVDHDVAQQLAWQPSRRPAAMPLRRAVARLDLGGTR